MHVYVRIHLFVGEFLCSSLLDLLRQFFSIVNSGVVSKN